MVICVAVGCSSDTRFASGKISFYKLPNDTNFKKQWLVNIKRDNLPSEKHLSLCHIHFEDNCFQRDLKVIISYYLSTSQYRIIMAIFKFLNLV